MEGKMTDIDLWLELNKKAMHLKPTKYQQWQFIVGLTGSLEDRIKLGQKALEMLKPKPDTVSYSDFVKITKR